MQCDNLDETFEQSWDRYKFAIITYATAFRSKSQDLKRALREDGKHVTYTTNLSFIFSHLCTTIMFPRL